jgi:hypothetical protein
MHVRGKKTRTVVNLLQNQIQHLWAEKQEQSVPGVDRHVS